MLQPIEHSLRTVVAEAARAALVNLLINGSIDPTKASFAAITPFVNNANLTLSVTQPSSFPRSNQIIDEARDPTPSTSILADLEFA